MKLFKLFIHILGFLPAIAYLILTLMFLPSTHFIHLLPMIFIIFCYGSAAIFLSIDKYKWIGALSVGIIVISYFIESNSINAFSSQHSASMAIFVLLFYSIYYYILKQ